jgi:hypothetical protein
VSEKSCGELLVERIVADMAQHGLEPDQRDAELFSVVADIANEIEELKRTVEVEGRTTLLKDGRPVVHGAVVELRLESVLAPFIWPLPVLPIEVHTQPRAAAG